MEMIPILCMYTVCICLAYIFCQKQHNSSSSLWANFHLHFIQLEYSWLFVNSGTFILLQISLSRLLSFFSWSSEWLSHKHTTAAIQLRCTVKANKNINIVQISANYNCHVIKTKEKIIRLAATSSKQRKYYSIKSPLSAMIHMRRGYGIYETMV